MLLELKRIIPNFLLNHLCLFILFQVRGFLLPTSRCKKYDISANKCCHDGWVRNFFGPISALYLKRSKEYAAHSTEYFADFKVRCKGAFIVLLAHKICQFYGPKWPILFMARWPVYKHSIFYNYHIHYTDSAANKCSFLGVVVPILTHFPSRTRYIGSSGRCKQNIKNLVMERVA